MELELYSTIEYTPGWYYTRFPGFYNVECYRILSDYSLNSEKYTGIEESKESEPECIEPSTKKIRVCIENTCDTQDGVKSEYFLVHSENHRMFHGVTFWTDL